MGQMAMAIDHGGQRTMPTGGAGSSIGGWPSETREEATMERGRSARCTGHLRGSVERAGQKKMVRHFPVRLQLKVLHKVLQAAALRSIAQCKVDPESSLVRLWFAECG